MKLKINKAPQVPTLELGDIIEWQGRGYLVIKDSDMRYLAKSLDGDTGLFGIWASLEALNKGFVNRSMHLEATVYKSSEYDLQIVKK